MATRISVSVKGPLGLDDSSGLLGELEQATQLDWHSQEVDHGPALTGGVVEIVLVALITKGADISVDHAVEAAKRLVERWRCERLDPPQTAIETQSVPDAETDTPEN